MKYEMCLVEKGEVIGTFDSEDSLDDKEIVLTKFGARLFQLKPGAKVILMRRKEAK